MSHIPTPKDNGFALGNLFASGCSPLQNKVLLMRASGQSIKEAARNLGCSTHNIQQALNNLFFKLHANNTPDLIAKAFCKAYLRALGLLGVAMAILLSSPSLDQKSLSRHQTNRPGSQQRVRTNGRPHGSDGIFWDPDKNQLFGDIETEEEAMV